MIQKLTAFDCDNTMLPAKSSYVADDRHIRAPCGPRRVVMYGKVRRSRCVRGLPPGRKRVTTDNNGHASAISRQSVSRIFTGRQQGRLFPKGLYLHRFRARLATVC
ncbi:hypothetical protein BaRGS_00014018 [Batillaria attramentaria]|uniref:Uncharacterized protein n=1 Tax=Batillaria attramentaria TaxID=370345 RepID=A0ABD0L656_9CAEN